MVKNASAGDLSNPVSDPGWGRPLEKDMATHSSILAWEIPWTEEPGGLQSMGWQRVGHDSIHTHTQHTHTHTHTHPFLTLRITDSGECHA